MGDNFEILVFFVIAVIMVARIRSFSVNAKKNAERMKKEGEVNKQVGITSGTSSAINYPAAVPGAGAAARQRQTRQNQYAGQSQAVRNTAAKPAGTTPAGTTPKRPDHEDELSTTEMLAQKAKLDQIEHQKEKLEQRRHEQKYFANYNYAKRYLLGDPVSPSEKMIICPNCAAENLIKIHESARKYNCYFCREKLES